MTEVVGIERYILPQISELRNTNDIRHEMSVSEPSIDNQLLIESSGDRTNFMDSATLKSLPYESGAATYKKKKITLPNGKYTCSIEENNFYLSGYYVLLIDDPAYEGGATTSNKYWIGHSDSKEYCASSVGFEVTKGYIYLAISGSVFNDNFFLTMLPDFMIEKGSVQHGYIPYGKYGISVRSNSENLVDVNKLATTPLAAEATGWQKVKIPLKNGKLKWTIDENIFLGKGTFILFTDDPNYNGEDAFKADPRYVYSWVGHTNDT